METLNSLSLKVEKAQASSPTIAKYPTDIVIELNSPEGNVFYIMGLCQKLARELELSDEEKSQYFKACQNSYYKDILKISQEWFGLIYI